MVGNHEEFSNDITLENLNCSVYTKFYWVCTYLCRKSNEGICFEVVNLAFSIFL